MNFFAMQNNNAIAINEEDISIDEHESIHTPQYEENFNGIMKLKRGPRRRIYAGKCSKCWFFFIFLVSSLLIYFYYKMGPAHTLP